MSSTLISKAINIKNDELDTLIKVDDAAVNSEFNKIMDNLIIKLTKLKEEMTILSSHFHHNTINVLELTREYTESTQRYSRDFQYVPTVRNTGTYSYSDSDIGSSTNISLLSALIQQKRVIYKGEFRKLTDFVDFTEFFNFIHKYKIFAGYDSYSRHERFPSTTLSMDAFGEFQSLLNRFIKINLMPAINSSFISEGVYQNKLSEYEWDNFQFYLDPIIKNYGFEGLHGLLRKIVAKLNLHSNKFARIFPIICKHLKHEDTIIDENKLYLLYDIISQAAIEDRESNNIVNEDFKTNYEDIAFSIISNSLVNIRRQTNQLLRDRQIANIRKEDLDNAFRHFRVNLDSNIQSVEREGNTIITIKFKQPITPKKIKYGNEYYMLTEKAIKGLKKSIKIKSLKIDFGRISNKYPTCWANSSCTHPNVSNGEKAVCLGTIRDFTNELNVVGDLPFPPISELVNMLSMINFDSSYRWSSDHYRIFSSNFNEENRINESNCPAWSNEIVSKFNPSIEKMLEELDNLGDL